MPDTATPSVVRRDNFALAQLFDWWRQPGGPRLRAINRLLGRWRAPFVLQGRLDPARDMTSLEQRSNLWLLAEQVIGYGIAGDFAEFGCFDGRTATLFGHVVRDFDSGRRVHLYDRFDVKFHLGDRNIEDEVRRNFAAAECAAPVIHRGDFERTVPEQLPGCIAFAHIDCGFGGDRNEHRRMVRFLLEHIYSRMPEGAIAVIMDYRHPALEHVEECNPGSRMGLEDFMANKPEPITALYAGEACHAFFRKRCTGTSDRVSIRDTAAEHPFRGRRFGAALQPVGTDSAGAGSAGAGSGAAGSSTIGGRCQK